MSNRTDFTRTDQMIAAYLDGSLAGAGLQAFERWLNESPQHPKQVARLAATDFAMREVCQETKADYLLDILNQMDEASGPGQLVEIVTLKPWWQQRLALVASGAIAASLLFSVVLILIFMGGPSSSTTGPVVQGDGTDTPQNTQQAAAATLTAERDAVWERRPGGELLAGQRFALIEGFAEITTARGAVAVLEAPTTIELLDDNALRLHYGKMVGRCETQQSKGLKVYTPFARVVDLSTSFGLEVDADGTLEAHVLEGEIALSPIDGDRLAGQTELLKQDEARRVSDRGRLVEVIDAASERFVRSLDDPAQIYAAAVSSLGPVAYYRFESETNSTVSNTGGDRYPATVHGPVLIVKTTAGHAARLDAVEGQPAYLELDQPITELRGAPRYTLECWARPATRHQGSLIAFMDARPGVMPTTASALQFRPGNSGSFIRFSHRNPPSNSQEDGAETADDRDYQPGQWVHLAAVVTPQDARLYVNGGLVDTRPTPGPMPDVQLNTLIGAAHPALGIPQRRQFNGLIDEIAIYADALSKDDIARHHRLMRQALDIE